MIDVERTRAALVEHGLGAWCLYDFRGSNPVLWHVLGTGPRGTSRRLFCVIDADGDAVLVCSALDADLVEGLGVPLAIYRDRRELHAELARRVGGRGRVAMEYSPGGELPIVSWVDAGTVELVRGLGVEVVSSGDLFAAAAAAWDDVAASSHAEAARHVVEIRDLALDRVRDALATGEDLREHAVAALILEQFERRGLETEGSPVVAAGPNSGNPHYEPRAGSDAVIGADQVLLIDLWARRPGPRHVFADVTWTAFTGPQPPPRVAEVFAAVAAGRDAALRLLRDAWDGGRTPRGFEVDRACRDAIAAAGFADAFIHRTGHSLGPGPRVHGLGPNLDDHETRDDRRLVAGTGFTVEPGVYLPEFGIRLEVDVHVHAQQGPVVTTPLQTELALLG